MQITMGFTCRECGSNNNVVWDTAGWVVSPRPTADAGVVPLACWRCRHVSGELRPNYTYRAEHRPSHERVPS